MRTLRIEGSVSSIQTHGTVGCTQTSSSNLVCGSLSHSKAGQVKHILSNNIHNLNNSHIAPDINLKNNKVVNKFAD